MPAKLMPGYISFLFLDDTLGDELITKDGVFANISFKIKGSAEETTNLSFQTSGAFGDADMQRINGINFVDGSVTIVK